MANRGVETEKKLRFLPRNGRLDNLRIFIHSDWEGGSMSLHDGSRATKGLKKEQVAKPALLLFGKDVSVEDIVEAINAERKRQLETGDNGRRMVPIHRRG